jgi:hypothetical protein
VAERKQRNKQKKKRESVVLLSFSLRLFLSFPPPRSSSTMPSRIFKKPHLRPTSKGKKGKNEPESFEDFEDKILLDDEQDDDQEEDSDEVEPVFDLQIPESDEDDDDDAEDGIPLCTFVANVLASSLTSNSLLFPQNCNRQRGWESVQRIWKQKVSVLQC